MAVACKDHHKGKWAIPSCVDPRESILGARLGRALGEPLCVDPLGRAFGEPLWGEHLGSPFGEAVEAWGKTIH